MSSLENEKNRIKITFSLCLGIVERRDAYLKDSRGMDKQGEKPAQTHLQSFIVLYFPRQSKGYVAFLLQKRNWNVSFLF